MSPQKNKVRSDSARAALHRQRAAQAAAQRRSAMLVRVAWITGAVLVAGMIGTIVWAIGTARPGTPSATSASAVVTPPNATQDGALSFGNADAPVTVAVYADFMCPYCGQFERANGDDLTKAVEAGTVKLEYHPMAFLDEMSSGTRYSTRAANAFVTLAAADPAVALRFGSLLYANQPAENTSGLTDEQLASFATQAGASAEAVGSMQAQTYVGWLQQSTQQAFAAGVTGTPTVKINGTGWQEGLYVPGALAGAITQAKG